MLGRVRPAAQDQADIERGLAFIAATGSFDVGQAVVVAANHILAVEAAEGTAVMLARVAELRRQGRVRSAAGTGVLVKAPKPQQDRRVDLPAIGAQTIDQVMAAGLAGVAVQAAGAITTDLQELVGAADEAGLFVVGVPVLRGPGVRS